MLKYSVPRWYQELSVPQMKRVFALGTIIKCDYDETVTGRTQRCLRETGITSTFVKISSVNVKKFHKISQLDPARFLCEIYRTITGRYFEDEGYKKFYDCNERIVLSAIALLKFSETIVELHRRLPMGDRVLPKKTENFQEGIPQSNESPDSDKALKQNDSNGNKSHESREKNSIRKPSKISTIDHDQIELLETDGSRQSIRTKKKIVPGKRGKNTKPNKKLTTTIDHDQIKLLETDGSRQSIRTKKKIVPGKRGENTKPNKKHTDESAEKPAEKPDEKLDEKPDEEIEEFIPENNSNDPISEVDSYITNLPKKFYPPGRENLSHNWQEWLYDRENEFEDLSKEADCILDDVRETIKLMFNPNACENCCACNQTRKTKLKKQTTDVSFFVIDSLILDDYNEKKYIIGSLVLSSPIPSRSNSFLNLPQIIPSEDKITKKKIISGITTDEEGRTRYFISGVTKDVQHIPKKIRHLPVPVKNVTRCGCQNEETEEDSESEISCADADGVCIAKKYRPDESPGCRTCTPDEHSSNKIYKNFEKACRERDERRKVLEKPIDHTTCTQRLFRDEEKSVVEVQPEPEKCTKCLKILGAKCQTNPLREIINQINREKLLERPKVSKGSEIKEYRDNIKLTVNGLIQNNSDGNEINNYVLSGITLHTPITITPVSSSESDLSELSLSQYQDNHHWSVTAFIPKPKINEIPKPIIRSPKKKKNSYEPIQKAIDELLEKIHQLDLLKEALNNHVNEKERQNIFEEEIDDGEKLKIIEREEGGADVIKNTESNSDLKKQKKSKKKPNLPELMKIALKEMAEEGFLLAKLPDCHKLPQLQAWIMFREGFILTKKHKKALLGKTLESKNETSDPDISAPSLSILKTDKKLTHADIHRIERELKLKTKIFHSKLRKLRVTKSRAMWNLMDYQMFPSLAFKQAYFIYQASKESDGHVERPYGFSRRTSL